MSESPETTGATLIHGAQYREKATGRLFILDGLRSRRRVCMIHDANGPGREVQDYLELPDVAERFEYVGCDHTAHCCTKHRVHVSPHRRCMLR